MDEEVIYFCSSFEGAGEKATEGGHGCKCGANCTCDPCNCWQNKLITLLYVVCAKGACKLIIWWLQIRRRQRQQPGRGGAILRFVSCLVVALYLLFVSFSYVMFALGIEIVRRRLKCIETNYIINQYCSYFNLPNHLIIIIFPTILLLVLSTSGAT